MVKKHNIRLYVILTLIGAMFLALLPFNFLKVHAAGYWENETTYNIGGHKYTLDEGTLLHNDYGTGYYFNQKDNRPELVLITACENNQTANQYSYPWTSRINYITASGRNGLVAIADGVTHIGNYAFYKCPYKEQIFIPDTVEYIGDYAFYNSKITGNIIIPDSVKSIGENAFSLCEGVNGKLTLGNQLTTIGKSAFSQCTNLTGNIDIPNSVVTIGDNAFGNLQNINTLTIGNSVKTIGNSAFINISATNQLVLPDTLESIGNSAFANDKFTGSLTIPNSTISIGTNAFLNCSGFDGTLTLGNSIKNIGMAAFQKCNNFVGDLIIPDSVQSIGNSAFGDCSGFNGTLKLSNSQKVYEEGTFQNCKGLKGDLIIPDCVTEVGYAAFKGCSGLDGRIELGNSLTTIERQAFYDCSGLTGELTIPESTIRINNEAFYNMPKITTITLLGKANLSDKSADGVVSLYAHQAFYVKDKVQTTLNVYSEDDLLYRWGIGGDNREILNPRVIFDSMGGTEVPTQKVSLNAKVKEPEEPVKEEFAFNGWYTTANYATKWNFEQDTVKDNMVLYASWGEPKQKFNVTFDLDGGNINGSTTIEPIEVEEYSEGCGWGYIGTNVGIPVKEGFIFDYWEPVFTNDLTYAQVSADTELKAIYYEDPDYGSGGEEGGTAHIYIDYNDTGDYVLFGEVEYGNALSEQPEEPQKSGYTFQYWYYMDIAYDDDGNPMYDEEDNLIENMVVFNFNSEVYGDYYLKPYFTENTGDTKNKYTVTFDTNGGTPVESQEITDGETVYKPTNPTKAADDNYKYTFAGWYTEDGTEFNFDNPITANTVLIAHWNKEDINNPEEPENPENPDDGHLVGDTITDFSVDNDILDDGKPDDVLGGDLIVSIPAELRLAYTSNGATFTKEDKVYAVGRVHSTDYLKILTPTNIEYTPDDATEELLAANPEARVPGVISFGDTENNNQTSKWLASELLLGVGKGSVTEGTGKAISSTVQKSDIKFIGSYRSVIDYNITLYQPNINRKVITEDLSQYENNQKPLTKEQLKELIEKDVEPIK